MKSYDVASRQTPNLGSPSRQTSSPQPESRLTTFWNRVWQRLVSGILQAPELNVWQEHDRHGKLLWHSYDPMTGRSFVGSESEMRRWIEERYSHEETFPQLTPVDR